MCFHCCVPPATRVAAWTLVATRVPLRGCAGAGTVGHTVHPDRACRPVQCCRTAPTGHPPGTEPICQCLGTRVAYLLFLRTITPPRLAGPTQGDYIIYTRAYVGPGPPPRTKGTPLHPACTVCYNVSRGARGIRGTRCRHAILSVPFRDSADRGGAVRSRPLRSIPRTTGRRGNS